MMERRLIWLFVVTVAVGGCEQLSPEMQLIHDAATALGGVEAVEQVATLRIEGSGNNFRLGQNPTPNAPLPRAAVESYIVEADLRNHRMRWEIASANFAGRVNTAVTAMDADVAFNVGQDGAQAGGREGGDRASRRVLPSPADAAPVRAGRDRGGHGRDDCGQPAAGVGRRRRRHHDGRTAAS